MFIELFYCVLFNYPDSGLRPCSQFKTQMLNELTTNSLQNFNNSRMAALFLKITGFAAPSSVQSLLVHPIGRTARSHSVAHPSLVERPGPPLVTQLQVSCFLVEVEV